jgi:chromate transport protein ChrA
LRRYRNNGRLQGFIRGVTVAVVGVLLGTSYLVARSTIRDTLELVMLAIALIALWPKWRVPETLLVAGGAAIGLLALLITHTR